MISILVPVLVFVMFFVPSLLGKNESSWVSQLPKFNASINFLTATSLILGRVSIAKRREKVHRSFMMLAFSLSAIFLVSYVIYHSSAEPTRYGGEGVMKVVYFGLLVSHIILAAIILPFILFAIYHALKDNRAAHKRWVKWTFPMWLYVAISGVLVYLLLSPYYSS